MLRISLLNELSHGAMPDTETDIEVSVCWPKLTDRLCNGCRQVRTNLLRKSMQFGAAQGGLLEPARRKSCR